MDWSPYFPGFVIKETNTQAEETTGETGNESSTTPNSLDRHVEIADIGCGYGGLLFALGPKFPETLILGAPPLTIINPSTI